MLQCVCDGYTVDADFQQLVILLLEFIGQNPTSAEAVLEELGEYLDPAEDLILDGGECEIGVESTIVSCFKRKINSYNR
jgi:hypothetical protein